MDGTHVRKIPHTSTHDRSPSFAPDGRTIVFSSDRRGFDSEIWTMRVDGSHRRQLTKNGGSDTDPAVSPDGRRIAFPRDGRVYLMRANGSNGRRLTQDYGNGRPSFSPDGRRLTYESRGALYVIRTDGTHRRRLTRGNPFTDEGPSFSPNGKKIAFSRFRPDDELGTAPVGLFVMYADGSDKYRVAGTGVDRVDWQPVPR